MPTLKNLMRLISRILLVMIMCRALPKAFLSHFKETKLVGSSMKKLVFTQIIFRHGSRTPLYTLDDIVQERSMETSRSDNPDPLGYKGVFYDPTHVLRPFEPTKNVHVRLEKLKGEEFTKSIDDWWRLQGRNLSARLPGGAEFGVLTTVGHQQLYELGKRIGKRLVEDPNQKDYVELIKQKKQHRVRSTYFERTIASAKSFMAGLMETLNEAPLSVIDIEVDNVFDDFLFPNSHFTNCLSRSISHHYKHLTENHPFKIAKAKWLKLLGISEYEYGLLELSDEPSTRIPLGLPVSAELKTLYDEATHLIADELIGIYRGKLLLDDFIRLAVGRLLLTFKTNLENALNHPKSDHPAFMAYAAHDNTLCVLSVAFDLFAKRWPWFGSYMMMQIIRDEGANGDLILRLTYNDDIRRKEGEEIVKDMKIEEFLAILNRYAINDNEVKALDQRLAREVYATPKRAKA